MQVPHIIWKNRIAIIAALLMAMLFICVFVVPESFAADASGVAVENADADAREGAPAIGASASEVNDEPGMAEERVPAIGASASEVNDEPGMAEESGRGALRAPVSQPSDGPAGARESAPTESVGNPDIADAPGAPAGNAAAPVGAKPLAAADDPVPYEESHVNMYRLYNPNSGEHFYTSSLFEAQSVATAGWQWEGIGWVAPTENDRPVFRLYNPNAGDHHYTLSEVERDHLVSVGWNYEGVGWYSDAEDQTAVFRQYNPNAAAGAHNFTTSAYEDEFLGSVGWNREGTAWYATDGPNISIQGFWLVTSAWGSLERYWVDSTGFVAKDRFIELSEGAGWRAYATSSGAVVRDRYIHLDNYWYQADSEGRLSDGDADRIISVSYLGGSSANLEMFAKDSNGWHSLLSSSAILGTNGINKDHEGDRKTPTGTFDITEGFGILDNPGLSGIPYTKVHEYLWWSGAPDTYNTMVDSRYDDPGDGEHLIEYSPFYNYALVIGYNRERIYGKGSAIFLHCDTGRASTAGCVGVPENVMVDIMRNATAHTKICIY